MALSNGTQLGPYEILAPIGAGGMGEVYRARDTNLKRDVAVRPGSVENTSGTHDGETLAGPLPIDTVLDYARQIAEALKYAP